MKGKLKVLLVAMFVACGVVSAQGTLSDEEYSYVTMDLQGVLDLSMTTNPQVDFTFSTIKEYNTGIIKYNAVQLEVDATVAWDLYVYASSNVWKQVESFSTNGAPALPSEILMIQSSVDNVTLSGSDDDAVGTDFVSLKGYTNSGIAAGAGPTDATQFLAGKVGIASPVAPGNAFAPGTAANNSDTHKFRIDYALRPGVPATFNNNNETFAGSGLSLLDVADDAGTDNTFDYAQAGYYYIEVVYSLVEDL